MGVIIVLFLVLSIRTVNADTNIKLGDTMTFSHASCKITNCVSNNDKVTVTFDEKECKYTGAKKGESVVKVTCDNNQQTTLNINVKENTAIVCGKTELKGKKVIATDLRAGAAMILAGLIASGTTEISNINHILRGYENIVEKLNDVGAQVKILEN